MDLTGGDRGRPAVRRARRALVRPRVRGVRREEADGPAPAVAPDPAATVGSG
jgi:hypothetical protein